MTDFKEKRCPNCGQQLRFPENIGGMVMACPSCGKKFHSDFKLGVAKKAKGRGLLVNIFEMPVKIVSRIVRFFSS